ncbi:hypothetical protein, partial [Streptococcus agalactiae]|uniref:hypothetical protein n=1 Tax=Streptococcus agalactiae TaxID=1311 RepID=UPI001C6098D8
FKVPTAKREIPPISLFEYKQVQNYLKSERQDVHNTYFKVPTAKREIPPISLFEYKQVQNYLKSERQDV